MNVTHDFDNIWYATEKRARSATKLIVYDDIGTLIIKGNGLLFAGSKTDQIFEEIHDISLSRQSLNWITYLVAIVVFTPINWVCYLIFNALFDISVQSFAAVILSIIACGILAGLSTKWIIIEHRSINGELTRSYFADGSKIGWGGIFGGTRKLHSDLVKVLETHSSA
jgi:hypothetical protein